MSLPKTSADLHSTDRSYTDSKKLLAGNAQAEILMLLRGQLQMQEESVKIQRALIQTVASASERLLPDDLLREVAEEVEKHRSEGMQNGSSWAPGEDTNHGINMEPIDGLGNDNTPGLNKASFAGVGLPDFEDEDIAWLHGDRKSNWFRAGLCELLKHPLDLLMPYDLMPSFPMVCFASLTTHRLKETLVHSLDQLSIFLALVMTIVVPLCWETDAPENWIQVVINTIIVFAAATNVCEVIAAFTMCKFAALVPDENFSVWVSANQSIFIVLNICTGTIAWLIIIVCVLRFVDCILRMDTTITHVTPEIPLIALAALCLLLCFFLFPTLQVATRSAVYSGALAERTIPGTKTTCDDTAVFFGVALRGQQRGQKAMLQYYEACRAAKPERDSQPRKYKRVSQGLGQLSDGNLEG